MARLVGREYLLAVTDLAPLSLLFDETSGAPLPLPAELEAMYGPLRMARPSDRPHVYANFVTSLDGIVAVDPPRGRGADISGGNDQDRAVMGLLRAVADGVVIGGGNLRAERDHVWTGEGICPELAGSYAWLRTAMGRPAAPLQVVVSGSGDLDLSGAVFSGAVPSVVVTTTAGAARLRGQHPAVRIVVPEPGVGWVSLPAVLQAVGLGPGALVLVESGPTSTTRYLAEGAVDEVFLTRAPSFIGRSGQLPTLALVEGRTFRPGVLGGRLLSARRSGDFLFLRYATRPSLRDEPARAPDGRAAPRGLEPLASTDPGD